MSRLMSRLYLVLTIIVGLSWEPSFGFSPPADYSVGAQPLSVCGADFDGDLDNDLAVVNNGDGTVSILINNGNETFQGAVDYSSGYGSRDIVAMNFNEDAHIDLAVLNLSGPSILLGNGDGTFQAAVQYTPPGSPAGLWSIASGDIDNDNDNDLAVVSWTLDAVYFFVNDGFGVFTFFTVVVVGDNPRELVFADLNGDNLDDLAVMDMIGHSLSVIISHGVSFDAAVAYPTVRQPGDIACADINGDTKLDLLATMGGNFGGYEIFLGNGDGTFGAGSFIDSLGYFGAVQVTDLDGSPGADIATIDVTTDNLNICLNNGSGGFYVPAVYVAGGAGSGAYGLRAVDLNGDNRSDIAVSNYYLNNVTVLFNDGLGGIITDVEIGNGELLPISFSLSQSYPNPFNPSTTIEYSLPRRNHVTIDVYNLLGRRVRTLIERVESAGSYTITWDGTDMDGNIVATGVYFYRFRAGDHVETKKMLLLK